MIAKFIVTLAFADAQTLKQADFRESAQEVGGQNAEAVIDAPEEGDRRQLALKRQNAIRRKTTTTTLPPKKKPLNRQNAVRRKLDEEDPEAEAEGEADKEDPEAETEGEADEEDEDSEAEAEGEADEEDEDSEAEAEGEAEGGLENDHRQLQSACVDKQATDDTCLSSWPISRAKNFKVGAKCSYWKAKKNYCLNDYFKTYQDSKKAMKDCCAQTCNYCGANKIDAEAGPTFAEKLLKLTDDVNAVKETVKGGLKAAEGLGHAVGLPVDRIKNKRIEVLEMGKNKAIELARKGGNKAKEAFSSGVRKITKGSKKRTGSKKPTKRRR